MVLLNTNCDLAHDIPFHRPSRQKARHARSDASFPIFVCWIWLSGEARFRQQKATDNRVKLMKEFVLAMRVVKYYAWEVPFRHGIDEAREAELSAVFDSLWVRGVMLFVLQNLPSLGIGLTFSFYSIANNLDVSSVFTTLALLNLLRAPFTLFSLSLSFGFQYKYVPNFIAASRVLT